MPQTLFPKHFWPSWTHGRCCERWSTRSRGDPEGKGDDISERGDSEKRARQNPVEQGALNSIFRPPRALLDRWPKMWTLGHAFARATWAKGGRHHLYMRSFFGLSVNSVGIFREAITETGTSRLRRIPLDRCSKPRTPGHAFARVAAANGGQRMPTPNQKANPARKFPYAGPKIQLRSTLNPLRSTLETTDASLGGSSKRGLQCGFTCNGRFVLFLAQMLFCSAWDAETFR